MKKGGKREIGFKKEKGKAQAGLKQTRDKKNGQGGQPGLRKGEIVTALAATQLESFKAHYGAVCQATIISSRKITEHWRP